MNHRIIFVVLLVLRSTHGRDLGLQSVQFPLARPNFVWSNPKTHVLIINNLSGGLDLTVHCKSKGDDLGVQLLHPNDRFGFHFRPNFFVKNTLFFCSFQWTGAFHYYDIYVQGRDSDRCNNCSWSVVQNGPCLFNYVTLKYDLCDNWNPPSMS